MSTKFNAGAIAGLTVDSTTADEMNAVLAEIARLDSGRHQQIMLMLPAYRRDADRYSAVIDFASKWLSPDGKSGVRDKNASAYTLGYRNAHSPLGFYVIDDIEPYDHDGVTMPDSAESYD